MRVVSLLQPDRDGRRPPRAAWRRIPTLLLLALATTPAPGSDYWVAPEGRDDGPGSTQSPFATLQYAADRASAGETVRVRPGTYAGFIMGWDGQKNGSAGRPITFRAESGVSIVRPNAHTPDGICLEGASYVVIDGFTVTGMPRAGIRSVRNRGAIIRRNRALENGTWGIYTSHSEGITIEENVAAGSKREHGIYVANSADGPVVRGNSVRGNRSCGIHINGDAAQGGDGIIRGALVECNVISENGRGGGSAINCDGVQESTFRNNLIYDNHARGISLFRADGGGPSSGNLVVNNTIVQAKDALWAINIKNASTSNRLYNNIILNRNDSRGSILLDRGSRHEFASDFNLTTPRMSLNDGWTVVDLDEWRRSGFDRHGAAATAEQLLPGALVRDFRPPPGSPADGQASAKLSPPEDLERRPRDPARGAAIGALEVDSPSRAASR